MTLIIAGYRQNKFRWNIGENSNYTPDINSGVFVIADSIISAKTNAGSKPLVSGFRKIIEVPVHVWQPHFVGELFQGYSTIFQTHKCLVAFAGSTLTAQHLINGISGHLAELKIDYERNPEIEYVVRKSCDHNNLISKGISNHYDENLFVAAKDYQNLLSAELISDVVEHSINKALESRMQHVLDPIALDAMYTDIILAVTCPIQRQDYLYKFKFKSSALPEGGIKVYCEKEFIEADKIAVIGMEKAFAEEAFELAKTAISSGLRFEHDMLDFVVNCVKQDQTFEIGLPVIIKTINGTSVQKEVITN
ncbi:hypothetical protein Rhein_3970 [Rheinheimera sp. A13L]|uniref:hypothetical protein n=1 Tax=Rheinheimera sp. A13L TaxID=506534 RepID=UPI0002124F3E|nr:hypothetical protein [Rheinheimera sp. A13L]EGM75978.1 hypothetical protein Rhein_3970 [Rheinheimera sp. A13L]